MGRLLIEIRASIFSSFEEIQITFSSNFYWNICVKICNLEQTIATVFLRSRFSCSLSRVRFGRFRHPLKWDDWRRIVVSRLRAVSLLSWSVEQNAWDTQMITRVTEGARRERRARVHFPLLNLKKKRDCSQSGAPVAVYVVRGFITRPFSARVRGKSTRDEAVRLLTWESKAPCKHTQLCWPTTPNIVGC